MPCNDARRKATMKLDMDALKEEFCRVARANISRDGL